ncbi:MAG: Nuclear protein SET [uncultured bacterium]|nr:MAG: Nuclear protein SET [uncultured bacterium]
MYCKFMPEYQKTLKKEFLKVKRSVSGLGLFTTKNIPRGTFIIEYTGELIPTRQTGASGGKYLFKINSRWAIDGKGRENLSRYINHSCKPNCEVQINRRMILIYALRDIAEGEELSYDYGAEYFLTLIKPNGCKCPYCQLRKLITS